MRFTRLLAAVSVIAAVAPAALATDRYFRDSFAVSPNGRYRIDAKSPDNAGGRPRPFASNFTYTLTEVATKKVVWERKQPMTRGKGSPYASEKEPSPVQVFVTDEGLVAARSSWDTLIFLDAADGHKRGEVEVLKAFPQSEQDRFVSRSTAGPIWSQESEWFFLAIPAGDEGAAGHYFVVRPFWNRRLIVDVTTVKHVDLGEFRDAASPAALTGAGVRVKRLLEGTMAEERRRATGVLNAAPEMLKNDNDYRAYWDVVAALHTAALLKMAEAEPQIRILENRPAKNGNGYSPLHAKAREALRGIGKTPPAGCGVQLYPWESGKGVGSPDTEHPFKSSVPAEVRIANVASIRSGMTVKEVTDLIGCPDAALIDGDRCFDYDIDAPEGFTLRVFLDPREESVVNVQMITPFAFLHDDARLRSY